jgi:hypothetical protein
VRAALGLPSNSSKKLTDAALDRLILREGLERVWARLDQLTKPSVPAVAA